MREMEFFFFSKQEMEFVRKGAVLEFSVGKLRESLRLSLFFDCVRV